MPSEKIRYYHVAGHYQDTSDASDDDPSSNLLVDTHGADVIEPVWALLSAAYDAHGMRPTLLERDFNFPDLDDMFAEVSQIKALQEALVHV